MSLHARVCLGDFATFEEALGHLKGKAASIDIDLCVVRTTIPQEVPQEVPQEAPPEDTTTFLNDIQLIIKRDLGALGVLRLEDLMLMGVLMPLEVLAIEHNPSTNHWLLSTHMQGPGGRILSVSLCLTGGKLGTYDKELTHILAPALLVFVSQSAASYAAMRRLNKSVRLPHMVDYALSHMESDLAQGVVYARAAMRDAGAHVPDLSLLTTPMTKSKSLGAWVDIRCIMMTQAAALQDRMDAIVQEMGVRLAALGSPEIATEMAGRARELRALMKEHHRFTAKMMQRITDC